VKQQKAAFSLSFFILVITKLSMNKRIKVHEQKKKKREGYLQRTAFSASPTAGQTQPDSSTSM